MGKVHFYLQREGGDKGNAVFHGFLRNAALSREHGPVGNKGHKILFCQFLADKTLVFCQKNYFFYGFFVQIFVIQGFLYTYRKKLKEDFFQFKGVDGSSIGRKTYCKADNQFFLGNLAGCAV